jgi:hypothetical protein
MVHKSSSEQFLPTRRRRRDKGPAAVPLPSALAAICFRIDLLATAKSQPSSIHPYDAIPFQPPPASALFKSRQPPTDPLAIQQRTQPSTCVLSLASVTMTMQASTTTTAAASSVGSVAMETEMEMEMDVDLFAVAVPMADVSNTA